MRSGSFPEGYILTRPKTRPSSSTCCPVPVKLEDLPESIDFWRSRIEGQTGEECFRVGLLFGPSGGGKTSLIRAGLLPVLSDRISSVYIEATIDGTEAALPNRLQMRCPDRSEGIGLASLLIAARKGVTLSPGKKLLIVIDQFERWLQAVEQVRRKAWSPPSINVMASMCKPSSWSGMMPGQLPAGSCGIWGIG